jgi:NAD-dependent DNA ligase
MPLILSFDFIFYINQILFCGNLLSRFLFGLGVRHIGLENARLLVDAFGGFPALWNYLLQESGSRFILCQEHIFFTSYSCKLLFFVLLLYSCADKLKTAGVQFHMLPRQRVLKKKVNASEQSSHGNEEIVAAATPNAPNDILYMHECAGDLQAIPGVGPAAVQSLLAFAMHPRSLAQVQGLLSHISFTSQSTNSKRSGEVTGHLASGVAATTNFPTEAADGLESGDPPAPASNGAQGGALRPLAGRVVVFTGKLESGMTRANAEEQFVALGNLRCLCVQSNCLLTFLTINYKL